MRRTTGTLLGIAAALWAGAAVAQGCDLASGEKLFARCKACHKTGDGSRGIGPTMFGIVGRPVASLPEYEYSQALRAFGEGGVVWNHERLAVYLEDPRAAVPGTEMAFVGLPREEERRDVICYLETLR